MQMQMQVQLNANADANTNANPHATHKAYMLESKLHLELAGDVTARLQSPSTAYSSKSFFD